MESSSTPVYWDPPPEAWRVAVPVTLVLLCTALAATTAILLFLFFYKKKLRRRSVVAPAPVANRAMPNGGPLKGSTIRKSSKSESQKKSSFNTTISFDDNDDELAVTRTQSLTVLIPKGGSLPACSATCLCTVSVYISLY